MKKTYISPNMLVVRLAMTQPLASSPAVGINSSASAVDGATLDVKESAYGDVNLWDDEW